MTGDEESLLADAFEVRGEGLLVVRFCVREDCFSTVKGRYSIDSGRVSVGRGGAANGRVSSSIGGADISIEEEEAGFVFWLRTPNDGPSSSLE